MGTFDLTCCLDPLRTAKGRLSLKALRLTPAMMSMYHEGDFTHEACVYRTTIVYSHLLGMPDFLFIFIL